MTATAKMPGERWVTVQVCFYCGTEGKSQCRNCGANQKVSKELRQISSMVEPLGPDISHLLRPIRTFGGVAEEFLIRQDSQCAVYGVHQGEMIVPTRFVSSPSRSQS